MSLVVAGSLDALLAALCIFFCVTLVLAYPVYYDSCRNGSMDSRLLGAPAFVCVIAGGGPLEVLWSARSENLLDHWLGRLFDDAFDYIADFVHISHGGFAAVLSLGQ